MRSRGSEAGAVGGLGALGWGLAGFAGALAGADAGVPCFGAAFLAPAGACAPAGPTATVAMSAASAKFKNLNWTSMETRRARTGAAGEGGEGPREAFGSNAGGEYSGRARSPLPAPV